MKKYLADDIGQEKELTGEEQLEAILFQFVNLYERWSEDRQKAAKQGAEIEKLIKQFALEVEKFSSIENAVIEKLNEGLQDKISTLSSSVYDALSRSVDKALDHSAHKIKESARYAENVFSDYQSLLSLSHWKLIVMTALSTIAVSLFIVLFLMPKPTLPLTSHDIQIYELGKSFAEVWPTLSKEKQRWFLEKRNNRRVLDQSEQKEGGRI